MVKRVFVAGTPESRPVLGAVATRLAASGLEVVEHYGGVHDDLAQLAEWRAAEVALCYMIPCSRAVLRAAPGLRAVVTPTIGCDWVDLEAASELGILVVNGQVPENYESMAEATLLLILAALYDLRGAEAEMRGEAGARAPARMLRNRTIGVIGYGGIAKSLIRRLQGWETRIIVSSRSRAGGPEIEFVELDDLLATSDVVVVLTSLTPETTRLLDAARLALMKPDVVFVNVARGAIVDEAALARWLAEHPEARAALDVFEVEPLPQDSPLRDLRNVILTPHSAGHTVEAIGGLPKAAVSSILTIAAGRAPSSTLNPAIVPRWSGILADQAL